MRHVRLPSLLQLAESELYTGYIVLRPGGHVALRGGAVVEARTDRGDGGIEAVRELFLVSDGDIAIELDDAVEGRPLAPTIALVMDGCKLLDEWTQLAPERYVLAGGAIAAEHEAHLDKVHALLAAMGRGLDVAAAVDDVGALRSDVVPALLALIEAGVIETPRPARPSSQHDPKANTATAGAGDDALDVDELVTRARTLMREHDFDGAERLLRAAMERRPNDRVLAQNMRHLTLRRVHVA